MKVVVRESHSRERWKMLRVGGIPFSNPRTGMLLSNAIKSTISLPD